MILQPQLLYRQLTHGISTIPILYCWCARPSRHPPGAPAVAAIWLLQRTAGVQPSRERELASLVQKFRMGCTPAVCSQVLTGACNCAQLVLQVVSASEREGLNFAAVLCQVFFICLPIITFIDK